MGKKRKITSGKMEVAISHSTFDIEKCEHLLLDSEDLDMLVLDVKTGERLRMCQAYACRGAAVSVKDMNMVCLECKYTFCSEHAHVHANISHHGVALWYDQPYLGYCYLCECFLLLSENNRKEDEWEMATRKEKDEQGTVASNTKDEGRIVAGDDVGGYVIRGMPNLGNSCYMNAVLQCLLALGKLRTMILGPEARLGIIGQYLQQLFVETSSANDTLRTVDPGMLLDCMRRFNQEFLGNKMQDSHQFLTSLRYALDEEVKELNRLHCMQGGAVFPTIGESIFRVQMCQTISCKSCSNNSVQHVEYNDIPAPVALPSKDPPARSVASAPRITSRRSPRKPRKKLFQQSHKNVGERIRTIPETGGSHIPGSELGDVEMEKNPKRMQVDSTEVKDVVHDHFKTQKNDVPEEFIGVPIKDLDFIPKLFDDSDSEEMGASTVGFGNPKGIGQPSLGNIEAKEYALSVEVSEEDKGKARSSDIIHDVAEHINSLSSIEDCLALLLIDQPVEWTCGNCSKVAEVLRASRTKNGEQMMANANVNTAVGGDQTEQSDRKTCPSEQSSEFNILSVEYSSPSRQPHGSDEQCQVILSGDSTTEDTSGTSCGAKDSANKKPVSHEGVQEAVPKCLLTEKQTNQLSSQDSQDTSTQNQGCGMQVKLDDHSAKQVEEDQTEQKDGNGGATQTILLTNLPPVLTIQLKRFVADISKLRGHVSFKEILNVGPFVHPSCVDKDNSSYRLVGVVEHLGPNLEGGHYIAYVRAGCNQQSSGSSSWVCANDPNIREVSLQEVFRCEAYILFYERMDGGSTSGNSTQQLTSSAMTKEADEWD